MEKLKSSLRDLGFDVRSLEPMEYSPGVMTLVLPGGKIAVDAWMCLRNAAGQTGHWPIICGDEKEYRRLAYENRASVREILDAVPVGRPLDALRKHEKDQRLAMIEWFRKSGKSVPEFLLTNCDAAPENAPPTGEGEAIDHRERREEWPDVPISDWSVHVPYDVLTREPLENCLLALIPTANPADSPAYLGFGGFNACPPPHLHVAFLRDWDHHYGAVPISISRDIIECAVASPPRTPDDARQLAAEHYAYCDDIVSQGVGTVERLAITRWGSRSWYFWWD